MTKFLLNYILKFFIKRMRSYLKIINSISIFASILTIFSIFRNNWMFKYFRFIIFIITSVSLIFNAFLFVIFAQMSDFMFPTFAWILALTQFFDYFPNFIQEFFSSIKNYIIKILKDIINFDEAKEEIENIKNDIETIKKEKDGEILSEKEKRELTMRREIDELRAKREKERIGSDKYTYWDSKLNQEVNNIYLYLIAGLFLISTGGLIYYFWGDISSLFKKGGRPKMDEFEVDDHISPSDGSFPSNESIEGRPSSYYQYFRRLKSYVLENSEAKQKLKDLANLKFLTKQKAPDGLEINEKGRLIWWGLPMPRTEQFSDGKDYYYYTDKNDWIRIINTKVKNGDDFSYLVNPVSGKIVDKIPLNKIDKNFLLSNRSLDSYFTAPSDSILNNPQFELSLDINRPTLGSLNIPSESLPGSSTSGTYNNAMESLPVGDIDVGTAAFADKNFIPGNVVNPTGSNESTPRAAFKQFEDFDSSDPFGV